MQGQGHPGGVDAPREERLVHGQLRFRASDGGQVMSLPDLIVIT
jgi:hypothetical protein